MHKSRLSLISVLFLLFSCSSQKSGLNPCLERNAVIEYGTSRVKYLFAEKNICDKQEIKTLSKTEWELDTNKGISQMPDGQMTFHPSVVEELKKISTDISRFAKHFKVKKIHGIATGVYRNLSHRQATFVELEKIINGKIKLLTPEEEASMGLLSIVRTEKPSGDFVVWDFGGNSMQFSVVQGGKVTTVTGLPGSNLIRAEVMKKLKKKKTPNPIGVKSIPSLEKHLKGTFATSLAPLAGLSNIEVYGIGGVHGKSIATPIFHLLNEPAAKRAYTQEQVAKLLDYLAKSSDLQIGGKYPGDQASNALAVKVVMKHLGWKTVKVSEQTLAFGYLLSLP